MLLDNVNHKFYNALCEKLKQDEYIDIISLKILRESSLEIPLGALFGHLPTDWEKKIENLNIATIHLDFETVKIYQIKEITNKSFKPFVYTCNEPSKIKSLWNAGLEGVITDDPLIFK